VSAAERVKFAKLSLGSCLAASGPSAAVGAKLGEAFPALPALAHARAAAGWPRPRLDSSKPPPKREPPRRPEEQRPAQRRRQQPKTRRAAEAAAAALTAERPWPFPVHVLKSRLKHPCPRGRRKKKKSVASGGRKLRRRLLLEAKELRAAEPPRSKPGGVYTLRPPFSAHMYQLLRSWLCLVGALGAPARDVSEHGKVGIPATTQIRGWAIVHEYPANTPPSGAVWCMYSVPPLVGYVLGVSRARRQNGKSVRYEGLTFFDSNFGTYQ
jgi:hypothetical protein